MGSSLCQQASAINNLFPGLQGTKKLLWFVDLCPALSPVSFDFPKQSSTGWKVCRDLVGDPWSGGRPRREPCRQRLHKQSRTHGRETQPLPGMCGRRSETLQGQETSSSDCFYLSFSPLLPLPAAPSLGGEHREQPWTWESKGTARVGCAAASSCKHLPIPQ